MARTDESLVRRIRIDAEAKIKSGAVLFACSSPGIDYIKLAKWTAQRIRQYLDLPVVLITDMPYHGDDFDQICYIPQRSDTAQRWFDDAQESVPWNNLDRCQSWDLSPFDRTLVLDVDYVVSSDYLRTLLDSNQDFLCYRHTVAVGADLLQPTFGVGNFPMWWATAMIFNRSATARWIFESMIMIRDNWNHYRNLYGITDRLFRNDIALSIAQGLVSGHTLNVDDLPGTMIAVLPEHKIQQQAHDSFMVTYQKQGRNQRCLLHQHDFHAMGKKQLEQVIDG
jgi:hypothetical protein